MTRTTLSCHLSETWRSRADFTWLIAISHRYVLCFTLWIQLTHSISHDYAVACHWFIVIGCLVSWLTIVSHMMYDFRTWLISYESWVSHMWFTLNTWLVLWVMIGLGMWRSRLLRVNWWISHYDSLESWVAWCGSTSHGWGKNTYIRAPSEHEFGFFTQPSKLLSLLLILSTIFISLSTFGDQSVLSDNDPPYKILIRVLVPWV